MPLDTSVAAQLLNWQPRQQQMAQQAMVLQKLQGEEQARQRALAARAPAFGILEQLGQRPQPQVPPPPGLMPPSPAAPPPGTLSPGGGNPQAQGGMAPPPQAAQAPQAGPQLPPAPPPPFRPLPTGQPGGAMAGQVPPPPAQAPQQPEVVAPPHIDIKKAIENISKNVPPEQRMEVLDQMMPVIQAAQADELKFFRAQTQAQTAAIQAYRAAIEQYKAETGSARQREQERHNVETEAAAIQRNEISERRMLVALSRIAGGQANVKGVEYIYPKGADGKPDQSQQPIGTRGTTKTGKIIYMDANGNPSTAQAMAGGTAKEGKGPGGAQAAVRANLVKSGVKNSLDRLAEIEKTHPNMNTSAFFGTHAENPLTKSVYGAGKGMQSTGQRQADAAWASFIDEAIPVFTGGLRGSDAFRRFLIEQAPGPGDDKASRTEKIRLLKANINGTSKAFFNKFASEPSMWVPGTKPEEVQSAPSAAPGSTTGGWKVEKVQ